MDAETSSEAWKVVAGLLRNCPIAVAWCEMYA